MWERRELGKWDFRIKCGDWMWGVHKVVLATNSKYFEEIFLAPQPEVSQILQTPEPQQILTNIGHLHQHDRARALRQR